MAPNTKHTSLISQQLINLQVIRTKVMDYQPSVPVADSASYWEWPSESGTDFSVEHIVSNLICAASKLAVPTESKAENDDYWAEDTNHAVKEETEPQIIAPQEQIDANDFWAEASHVTGSSDDYWNTASIVTRTEVRNPNLVEVESASYWQEKTHGRSSSDAYWQEDFPSQNYWTWNVAAKTERDDYWGWASPVSTF